MVQLGTRLLSATTSTIGISNQNFQFVGLLHVFTDYINLAKTEQLTCCNVHENWFKRCCAARVVPSSQQCRFTLLHCIQVKKVLFNIVL